jgi:hypothetical protein
VERDFEGLLRELVWWVWRFGAVSLKIVGFFPSRGISAMRIMGMDGFSRT